MPEIIKDLVRLYKGDEHKATGEEYVIKEDHSIFDILRYLLTQCDTTELKFFVEHLDKQIAEEELKH